jgi:hypothetical protein
VLSLELASALGPAGYEIRFQESFQLRADRKGPPPPTAADLAACVLLLEQVERTRYPRLDELAPGCRVVRFPSLDTNLLWPFSAINPYDLPEPPAVEGPYPYGDRVLLRCIEKDWPVDRIVDHYLDHYDEYRLDMGRIAELERARREARDAKSDVKMADALADLISTRVFATTNHPMPSLLRVLLARIAAACERDIPAFAGPAIVESVRDGFAAAREWTFVPINPGVAADLGLTWSESRDEVESYVRGFARRRPDVRVAMLRTANVIGPQTQSPIAQYFHLPVLPTVLGFDPRMQFLH